MPHYHSHKQNLLEFIETKSQAIILLSSLIILFVTLSPFDFAYPYNFSWADWQTIRATNSTPGDIIVNLALFMPFGWGLTVLFMSKKFNYLKSILLALVFSFCFSSMIEFLQIFLLLRRTSLLDIFNNSLSGLLGGVFFLLVRNQLKKINFYFKRSLLLKIFITSWLIYLLIIGVSLVSLKDATKLSNWDTQFPLMIGNEQTANRPWQGEMSYLYISDRFLSEKIIENFFTTNNQSEPIEDYLLGAYLFDKLEAKYTDQLDNLPSLTWQKSKPKTTENIAISLDKNNWLQTEVAPNQLTQSIQHNSQFTFITKIKTHRQKQQGAARIFSLSQNIHQRNLSLEQLEQDLKIRLRTPFTGNNGRNPELILKNFFDKMATHQIAIAYDGKQLKIYIDQIENVYHLKLNSEAALFWSVFYLLGSKTPIYMGKSALYNFLYHSFLFIPFGFLLASILIFLPKNRMLYLIIFFLGIIVPSLFIKNIVVLTNNGNWSWHNISLSMFTIALTSLLFKTLMALKFKNT